MDPTSSPSAARVGTTRQLAEAILLAAGWGIPSPPLVWSSRMSRCAGLFVVRKDSKGAWRPEIRLSTPLLRRRDRDWPVQVCGCLCRDPEAVVRRILEHELIHYKLWVDGDPDWGHTRRFSQLAQLHFSHQSVTHGIGSESAGNPAPGR